MTIDASKIYFNAVPSRDRSGFVIDFRHASSDLVLDMAEANLVTGLPEGMVLTRHPDLPGRAAWTFPGDILKAGMAMRRAGFAASKAELSAPRQVPPRPEAEREPRYIDPRPAEPLDRERLVFNLKTRETPVGSLTFVQFGLIDPGYPEDPAEEISLAELLADPAGAGIKDIVMITGENNWRSRSRHDEAGTVSRLEALGFTHDARVFMWHEPRDLTFGISRDRQESMRDNRYVIFIVPKDPDAPFVDDLRDEHLPEVPPYFDGNLCENTWELGRDADRDAVIADMVARGYTHDPDLDGEMGG